MTLPQISLPFLEGIVGVPILLHPLMVHFVIVLPLIVLIIELINVIFKRRSLSVISFLMILFIGIFLATAYITGSADGKEAFDLLTLEGQEALKGHKILGSYLIIGFAILFFFKVASLVSSHFIVKIVYLFFLISFIALLLKQGKDGGELVYNYGANVAQVKVLDDKLFDLEYSCEDLEKQHNELQIQCNQDSSNEALAKEIEVQDDTNSTSSSSIVEDLESQNETNEIDESIQEDNNITL